MGDPGTQYDRTALVLVQPGPCSTTETMSLGQAARSPPSLSRDHPYHRRPVAPVLFKNTSISLSRSVIKQKNGHILPTGQWYAPSAVINDALIMP